MVVPRGFFVSAAVEDIFKQDSFSEPVWLDNAGIDQDVSQLRDCFLNHPRLIATLLALLGQGRQTLDLNRRLYHRPQDTQGQDGSSHRCRHASSESHHRSKLDARCRELLEQCRKWGRGGTAYL